MSRLPVGLVACCKTKLDHPAPAEELYTGHLFRLSRKWLLPRTDGWAILSAKHGLVLPRQVVEPYEQTLVGACPVVVRAWEAAVGLDLRAMFPGREFLVISGRAYLGALAGLPHKQAFGGLKLGEKLSAIMHANEEDRVEENLYGR